MILTRLKMEASSGETLADFNKLLPHTTPIELSVDPVTGVDAYSMQASASEDIYMQNLVYLFGGVTNHASGKIKRTTFSKNWAGSIFKEDNDIRWNFTDKSSIVVYEVSTLEIKEHFYAASSIVMNKTDKKVVPVWNDSLIEPTTKTLKEGVVNAIALATMFNGDYKMVWGSKKNRGLIILDKKGVPIKVDDIRDDETYVLFRLLLLIASKDKHVGVLCVDAHGMSDKLINTLIDASKFFYSDGIIFLKHLSPTSMIRRETITLPPLL